MKLFVLGVNHKTAPVDVREKIVFSSEQVQLALTELKEKKLCTESIILSTCNRTEIYCNLKESFTEDPTKKIKLWLHQFFNITNNTLNELLYEYYDLEAIKHIMCVASGLNSLVLGEPQIFGQLKEAYRTAQKSDTVHQKIDCLFQHIFKTVKQIRTHTAIGSCPVSVAFSAVTLSEQFFGNLSDYSVLLLGAGETTELVARHLKERGTGQIVIANRTLENAHKITSELGGYAINLAEIPEHIQDADIIISSTSSPSILIEKNLIVSALKRRKNKPMFMVDIAVPRDIDPEISLLNNVYLYSVDDLTDMINENKKSRQDAAQEAEEIIDTQASAFMAKYQAIIQASPIIQAYREEAYKIRDHAIDEVIGQINKGIEPEIALTKLANQLTNRLLHTATSNVHQAGIEGKQHLIDSAEAILLTKD